MAGILCAGVRMARCGCGIWVTFAPGEFGAGHAVGENNTTVACGRVSDAFFLDFAGTMRFPPLAEWEAYAKNLGTPEACLDSSPAKAIRGSHAARTVLTTLTAFVAMVGAEAVRGRRAVRNVLTTDGVSRHVVPCSENG
jgi:hypothetical protein